MLVYGFINVALMCSAANSQCIKKCSWCAPFFNPSLQGKTGLLQALLSYIFSAAIHVKKNSFHGNASLLALSHCSILQPLTLIKKTNCL